MPHRQPLCELTQQILFVAFGMASSSWLIIASVWDAILSSERLTGEQVFLLTLAGSILGSVVAICFLFTKAASIREWCLKAVGSSACAVIFAPCIIYKSGWEVNAYVVLAVSGAVALFAKIIIRAVVPLISKVVGAIFAWWLKKFGIDLKDEDK